VFPDLKNNTDEDPPDTEEDLSEEEGDEDGDGEDQASLALNTPEPARALQAANPAAKGKGDPKAKKGAREKATNKASAGEDGRAIDVTIGDEATGLEESSTEEKPAADTQDISAFDRDEITDPDMDINDVELLGMMAGLGEKPWENEKLSLTERMMLKQGYERNVEALKQQQTESEPEGQGKKSVRRGVAAAATVVVAAGVVAAGIKTGAEKGPAIAGVSRGPQRAADQDRTQAPVKTESRKITTETILKQARQNADEVTMRRAGQGLAPALNAGKTDPARQQGETEDLSRKLLQDLLEDQALESRSGPLLQTAMPEVSTDPEMQFRQMMNMIYMTLGTEALMNVSPYRAASWDEKRLEQKENSADVTVLPPPEKDPGPAPELQYRHDIQMNLGPGGAG
jgi:hypothetical protein